MRVTWSPRAIARVEQARAFIAGDRPLAASEWTERLWARIELLRDFPLQGRIVPEWNQPEVREIPHHPYRVIYRIHPDHVEILTLHPLRGGAGPALTGLDGGS